MLQGLLTGEIFINKIYTNMEIKNAVDSHAKTNTVGNHSKKTRDQYVLLYNTISLRLHTPKLFCGVSISLVIAEW